MMIDQKIDSFKIILVFAVLILLCILFVYGLGNAALQSYDEAWYGEISRNILLKKNLFELEFNGAPYTDHPPFGFWLMATSTAIFGSSEFSIRLVSALLGVGTILVVFLIGQKLKDKTTGLIASGVLLSSMWFVFRARSGNLDVPLLFFESLTVLFVLQKQKKFLNLAGVSLGVLFLTKTLVGVGVLPVVFYLLWQKRKNLQTKDFFKALIIFLMVLLPWYMFTQLMNDNFYYHHFFEIGARGQSNSFDLENLRQGLSYLAIGIGKWYKVFLGSFGLLLVGLIKEKKNLSKVLLLILWLVGFSAFLFSGKVEIWHLLPMYPPIALLIAYSLVSFVELIKVKYLKIFLVIGCLSLTVFQFRQFANLIYLPNSFSAEKDISIQAAKYDQIYLMETFLPVSVYYSQKNVYPLHWDPQAYQKMTRLLKDQPEAVFIINQTLLNSLNDDEIGFDVITQNASYMIVGGK